MRRDQERAKASAAAPECLHGPGCYSWRPFHLESSLPLLHPFQPANASSVRTLQEAPSLESPSNPPGSVLLPSPRVPAPRLSQAR